MEGVVSSLLQGVLSMLSSPIQKEFGLLWGIEKEHQKLKSNLLAIEAVLQDADVRQEKEMAVRDWLRKLKDIAYDADDLVDEFMVEALRRKVEIRDGMQKKVQNFFSSLNPGFFCVKMAYKMKELRERLDEIAKEKNDFHFKEGVLVDNQPPISRTRETHSYVIGSEVYGRDNEKAKIIDSLINSGEDEVPSVISIVGMGGLGKTTLAQLVYNDKSVATHFDLKMWVCVSEDFDVGRLVKDILQSATNDRSDLLSMKLLQTRLREKLSGKRYLLVLDDVWNEVHEKWDKLKTILKCGAQGSKIIVTTHSNKVALIMGTLPAHHLGTLSKNDSWSLFEKLVHPDPKLVSIGKKMVRKCGGVPLAVKTLGGMMSSKRSESEWLSIGNSELWESPDATTGILPALLLSYKHLTPHLKQCFAYCAIFPKGDFIDKDKLIKQWVAQGFIQSDDENKLLEEKGEDFFNDLLSRSLFEDEQKHRDNAIKFKMHDLIHDLLRFVAGTESINVEASTQIVPKETRHLSLCDSKWVKQSKNLEALEKCEKLRSIFLHFESIDVNVCLCFKYLKVLDLSCTSIQYLPNSLGKLKHLRYLDVSNTRITKLPETICNLHSLQTLILKGTNLEELPKGIKRMTSLRHIECEDEVPMPNGIGEYLTCLQTLRNSIISQDGAGIEELKCLNKLRGKLCIKGLENIRSEKCAREANLMEKQHLYSLSLSCSDVETITDAGVNLENVIENLEPHSNLKELTILKYRGLNFPSWLNKLTNLVAISLSDCCNYEHLPLDLAQLPFLEKLEMSNMESMKYIFVFDGAYNNKDIFPSLEQLCLSRMPSLEEWSPHQADNEERQEEEEERDEQVLLRCLRMLVFEHCPKLIQLPTFLFSPALKSLEISHCNAIRSLPESVGNLIGLVQLEISTCLEMRALPESFGNLTSLHHLKLTDLHVLTALPESFGNLKSLHYLSVENCHAMRSLPESMGNLKSLHRLSIENCRALRSLPESMVNLKTSLVYLGIKNCPNMKTFPLGLQILKGGFYMENCPRCPRLRRSLGKRWDGRQILRPVP